MSWQCKLFESREAVLKDYGLIPVGAMWFAPNMLTWTPEQMGLASNYLRDWRDKRSPLFVRLPDGSEWCVDTQAYSHSAGGYHGEGWTVTGEPPNITVSPSINYVGRYHGFLQNGVITDDCEGRTFPNARGCFDTERSTE